jgi:MFS family permease
MNNGYRMLKLGDLRKKISLKGSSAPIFLVINSFVWYLLTYIIFNSTISLMEPNLSGNDQFVLFATYYISIAVTAIIGSKLFLRRKPLLLSVWLLLGGLATFFLIGLTANNMPLNFAISAFFGASIGLGLPSCLSYFANLTSVENRGSAGGVAWSAVGVGVLAFGFLISGGGIWAIIALTAWRLLGGVGFWILNRRIKFAENKKTPTQKTPSYLELIRKREILLYLFPWVMFSIINFAEAPMLEAAFTPPVFAFVQIIEFGFIGVFAVIGGIAADLAGRKRVVIAGFVMLGIEYATLSAFSGYPEVAYLFATLDGITWGLLFSVFFTTIWGDLGENQEKEKYYTLGGVPFLLAGFLSIVVKPLANNTQTITTAFTLASFFLFVAVIPLMYAPETLPEKVMKDRDLKSYVDKAKKVVDKETEKKKAKEGTKPENHKEEIEKPAENESEYEEAEKLAEKYY